jgi:hypothetical protein
VPSKRLDVDATGSGLFGRYVAIQSSGTNH